MKNKMIYLMIALMMLGVWALPAAQAAGPLKLVATTTMLADLARNLGGEHVQVTGLMGPGIDPHLYKASAGDVNLLQNADIILMNGLHLEGKMGDIFEALKHRGRQVISLEDGLDPERLLFDEDSSGAHDPHIWFDVSLWQQSASYVAQRLAEIDPDHAAAYQGALEKYVSQLEQLKDYVKSRVAELKEAQRVLVTAHDAFQYFGRAFDFQVRGLQGISTASEAGTGDMSALAAFIAENRIQAIFIESSIPPRTIEALQAAVKARGFEVKIGGELYSDSLGDAESGDDTYIATFRANIDTIVDALKQGD